jgi:hypothetical protein
MSWFCGIQRLISVQQNSLNLAFGYVNPWRILSSWTWHHVVVDGYRWFEVTRFLRGTWISRERINAVGIEGETQADMGPIRAPWSVILLPLSVLLFSMLGLLFCPKIEATSSHETSVYTHQTTRSHIPDDSTLHSHYCQKPIYDIH